MSYRMLQSYSTGHNHTCVNEKNYKLIISHLKRSTLKSKTLFYVSVEGRELSPPPPPLPPVASIKYFKICKVYELETSRKTKF